MPCDGACSAEGADAGEGRVWIAWSEMDGYGIDRPAEAADEKRYSLLGGSAR
jgi:hypothetical protein